MPRSGADLALLLFGGFRVLAQRGTAELAARGFEDIRPAHDFALRSIASGADSASELGRRMSVSKQAAAKTIGVLEERGYVAREPDPQDRRRLRLTVTARGSALMREGDAVFDELREAWKDEVGADELHRVEDSLRRLVGRDGVTFDTPGGAASDLIE